MAVIFVMMGAMKNMIPPEDKLVAMRAGITFSNPIARAMGSRVPGLFIAWWNGRTLLGIVALCGVALLALVGFRRSVLSENTLWEGVSNDTYKVNDD